MKDRKNLGLPGRKLAHNPPEITPTMLQEGILNPQVLDLVARIRHTNTLVICDWAFPYWKEIETVDISLSRGIPSVLDVLKLLQPNFKVGTIWQAEEFLHTTPAETIKDFDDCFATFLDAEVVREPHLDFKTRVPEAIGLIRTGDPTAYGNVIVESV